MSNAAEPVVFTSALPLDMFGQILTSCNVKQTAKFLCSSQYVAKVIGWRHLSRLDLAIDLRKENWSVRMQDDLLLTVCPRIQQWLPHVESLSITTPCICSREAMTALCNLLQAVAPFLRNVTLNGWLGGPIRDAVIPRLNLRKLEYLNIGLSSAAGPFLPLFSGPLPSLKHVCIYGMELTDSREILFLLAQNTNSLRTLELHARYYLYGDGVREIIKSNPNLERLESQTLDTKGHIPLNCLLSLEPSSVEFSAEGAPPIPAADWVKLAGWCKERLGLPIANCRFEYGHSAWMACVSRALEDSDQIQIPSCESLFNECYCPNQATLETFKDLCYVLSTSNSKGAAELQEWTLQKLRQIIQQDPSLRGYRPFSDTNKLLDKFL